jgi:hypothetical protein
VLYIWYVFSTLQVINLSVSYLELVLVTLLQYLLFRSPKKDAKLLYK